MPIMSFEHLKKKSLREQPEKTRIAGPIQESSPLSITAPPIPVRTTFRRPAVMLSALIARVNYCRAGKSHCERFRPVPGGEDGYGFCWRPDRLNPGIEEWKKIPESATVSRCWWWILEDREKNGRRNE